MIRDAKGWPVKGNDLSAQPTPRYYVMAEVVLRRSDSTATTKGWRRLVTVYRTVMIPDLAALSSLWRFSSTYGVRLELVFAGDLATDAVRLWDELNAVANPFNDWHVKESLDAVVQEIPYRPDILGYIDIPSRRMLYGGKGYTLLEAMS